MTRCSPTGCTPSSSTATAAGLHRRRACSTSGCRTPGPDGSLLGPGAARVRARPGRPVHRLDPAGRSARLPPRPGGRVAAAVAPLSEADAAKRVFTASAPLKAGRASRCSTPSTGSPTRCATSSPARRSRATCPASSTGGCPSPTSAGASRARPSTSTSSRSGSPRCGAGSSSGRAPLPRCSSASRAGAARPSGSTRRSTRSAACCGCSVRRRPSRSRATSTRRSRTSRRTGPRTSSR